MAAEDGQDGLSAAESRDGRERQRELCPRRLQFRRGFNPAWWYGAFGALVLVMTFWFPLASANRTARVEERADRLAEILLAEGMAAAPIDFGDQATAETLFARVLMRAVSSDVFVGDLELLPPGNDPSALTLQNKHYLIGLRSSPRDSSEGFEEHDADPANLPLEAIAWPIKATGPGHAVFFYPEDAEAAYTRNLSSNYTQDKPPQPGRTHRRPNEVFEWEYRDFEDERWLLFGRPATKPRR